LKYLRFLAGDQYFIFLRITPGLAHQSPHIPVARQVSLLKPGELRDDLEIQDVV
jgi:hypothetical protein